SEAVFNVSLAVSAKSTLVALEGILLVCEDNTLTLTGYNLDLGIKKNIEVNTIEQGSIVLNSKLFSEILRKMPADDISISTDEKYLTVIKGGGAEFTILGISTSEYPEIPVLKDGNRFEIPCHVLKNMINQTLFAVAVTEQTPVHTGSLFDIKSGILNLVSVDGYRLALRKEKVNVNDDFSFVVPGKTLSEICKLLHDDQEEPVGVNVSSKHIIFEIDGYMVISRLLDGEFLDYHAAIPRQTETRVKVSAKDFISSIERASIIITDRIKSPIKAIFDNESITVSCTTSMGKVFDQIGAQSNGESVTIGFNNKYMIDALKATECDEVYIDLNGPLSPMKVVPLESDNFLFLVLPVRLKTE
ncbi:MAG: polymerase subunit beta, partial [Oscillospiraceae bacterium]|nr:polymerase subunit beta [Oscillospiraceae bacterium]